MSNEWWGGLIQGLGACDLPARWREQWRMIDPEEECVAEAVHRTHPGLGKSLSTSLLHRIIR